MGRRVLDGKSRATDISTERKGRFYAGTYSFTLCMQNSTEHGGLYRYSKKKGLKVLTKEIRVSVGFTWNYKTNQFYLTDSCKLQIQKFNWSPKTGRLCNSIY